MKQVEMGMTKDAVVALVGKPRDCQHFQAASTLKDDTLLLGLAGSVVFEHGQLTSKNRY